MKKLISLVLAALLIASVFAGCGAKSGSDLKYVQDKGKLVVGITDYAPMDFKDENGNWTGFDAEFATLFARELGVDLTKVTGTGPNGRIVWRDVDAAAQAKAAAQAGTAVAGFYTIADIRELLAALDSLNGALTLNAFVEKAAAKLETSMALRFAGEGIEGMLPGMEAGEAAVLAVGAPMDGKVRLHLAYAPAVLDDEEAAKLLRTMRTLLEHPLMLLV